MKYNMANRLKTASRALCAGAMAAWEWLGFWWNAILSLPEWAAEEREIRAEEEEMRARTGRA